MNALRFFLRILILLWCASASYALAQYSSKTAESFVPSEHTQRKGLVLVLSGASGPTHYRPFSSWLAREGFVAVLVDSREYWKRDGVGDEVEFLQRLDDTLIENLRKFKMPGKAAVIGFSLGGAPALAFATQLTARVRTVIGVYPSTAFIQDMSVFSTRVAVPVLLIAGVEDENPCCAISRIRELNRVLQSGRTRQVELVELPHAAHGFNLPSNRYRDEDTQIAEILIREHLTRYLDSVTVRPTDQ